jgi:hypothetical protein
LHADWLISRRGMIIACTAFLPHTQRLVLEYVQALAFDQLYNIMRNGQAFVGFREAAIDFPPTFKYDVLRTIRHKRRRSKAINQKRKSIMKADTVTEALMMTQMGNLHLSFHLGRRRSLTVTRGQMKTMTRARNRITFAGGWLILKAAAGLSSESLCLPHNAQSPSGPSLSTHQRPHVLYVRGEPTPSHPGPEVTERVLGASRQHRSSANVGHHQPIMPLTISSGPRLHLEGVYSRIYHSPATGRRRPKMIEGYTTRAANDVFQAGVTASSSNRRSSPILNPRTTRMPRLSAPQ